MTTENIYDSMAVDTEDKGGMLKGFLEAEGYIDSQTFEFAARRQVRLIEKDKVDNKKLILILSVLLRCASVLGGHYNAVGIRNDLIDELFDVCTEEERAYFLSLPQPHQKLDLTWGEIKAQIGDLVQKATDEPYSRASHKPFYHDNRGPGYSGSADHVHTFA